MIKFNLPFQQKQNRQSGFSLVEVLIAIAVLSVGMLSVAAMQTSAVRGNARSNNITERSATASNHLEKLLSLPFTHADLAAGSHDPSSDLIDNDGDGTTDEADDDGEASYAVTWTVTDDSSRKKTIDLVIAGTHYGVNKTVALRTVKIR